MLKTVVWLEGNASSGHSIGSCSVLSTMKRKANAFHWDSGRDTIRASKNKVVTHWEGFTLRRVLQVMLQAQP